MDTYSFSAWSVLGGSIIWTLVGKPHGGAFRCVSVMPFFLNLLADLL